MDFRTSETQASYWSRVKTGLRWSLPLRHRISLTQHLLAAFDDNTNFDSENGQHKNINPMKQILKLTALCTVFCVSKSHAQGVGSASLWGTQNYSGGSYSATGGIRCATAANTGICAVAFGYESSAYGYSSFAQGFQVYALGNHSTAFGINSTAQGPYSFAQGYSAYASGNHSVAIGQGSKALALHSVAAGPFPVARGNPTTWVATDPVFTVANGQSDAARSNALVVLKSGAVLVKPAGDLSMGSFTAGIKPDDTAP